MLGWWILITLQSPEERKSSAADTKPYILAQWETGLGGRDWIKQLIDEGQAELVHSGAYPDRYTAKAGDILPLVAYGPLPHSLAPSLAGDGRRITNLAIHGDRIFACAPDQVLTIETWDLS
jgi:hypothetical protein